MYASFFELPQEASTIVSAMTATRHDDGSNDRRIGVPTPTTFPAELIARIAPPATNRQRHTRATRSGACDPAGLRPDHGADVRGFGDCRVAPGFAVGKQRRDQPAGQRMAGPQPAEMPDDRSAGEIQVAQGIDQLVADRKSTRLNSSHSSISY